MKRTLVWLRNDLRVHDNLPLFEACNLGEVLPVYCFDPLQFKKSTFGFNKTGPFRSQFLLETVQNLRDSLMELGGNLVIRHGNPIEELSNLVQEHNIDQVFVQKEFTNEEVKLEDGLREALNITIKFFWGSTLYHINDLEFSKESIPDVFSIFRKTIEKTSNIRELVFPSNGIKLISGVDIGTIPGLVDLGVEKKSINSKSVLQFKGGETEALERLKEYIWDRDLLKNYKFTRNGMLGADYSSKFSPWLANGSLSPRKIFWEVKKYERDRIQNESTYWLIFELIWRDYFKFSAWKYGARIFQKGGIQKKDRLWRTNRKDFDKWAKGETGIPLIDANMRELNETGFISNRGRQNVASFLAQNLNIDWRMGAEYFESLLLDYDPCSNYGNWAYNATVGHDPRNRYFNILNQAERYDKTGEYVRYWLPELKHIPKEFVHKPHTIPPVQQKLYDIEVGIDYPKPIIDLEKSYEEIKNRE